MDPIQQFAIACLFLPPPFHLSEVDKFVCNEIDKLVSHKLKVKRVFLEK